MKKFLFIAALASIVLAGCDAISKDIEVNNVKFEFTAKVRDGLAAVMNGNETPGLRAAAMNSFNETITLKVSDIGDDDVTKYKDNISKVVTNRALIGVTTEPSGNYIVEGLTVSATGVSGSLYIASYTVGAATIDLPDNILTYTDAFFEKLLKAGSLKVNISGKTTAPAGTEIKISYENDLVFTASLF